MQVDKPSTIAAAVALSCIGVFGILAAFSWMPIKSD